MNFMNKLYKINSRILCNKPIESGYFVMSLEAKEIAERAGPGQFLHIRCSESFNPLLRRPFSIHNIKTKGSGYKVVEILYEVIGKGTEILSRKEVGDFLDILGPLGTGFRLLPAPSSQLPAILIAGGMGVAPLVFLAERLIQKNKVTVLIGARRENKLLCEKEFRGLGCEVRISTDDGSRGFKGKVVDLLKRELSTMNYEPSAIYACGPNPMLQYIAEICKDEKIECQVSLEENIACGLGACLGCVVETINGYKRVCKDGPVFDAEEILF